MFGFIHGPFDFALRSRPFFVLRHITELLKSCSTVPMSPFIRLKGSRTLSTTALRKAHRKSSGGSTESFLLERLSSLADVELKTRQTKAVINILT